MKRSKISTVVAAAIAASLLALGCGGGTPCRDGCDCNGTCRACPCPSASPLVEDEDAGR